LAKRGLRYLTSVAVVVLTTFIAHSVTPVNATTVGFAYLLLVLILASTWGFGEAAVASILATLAFNFFFLPPVGTLTIADPQNWIALFSFLATALIAGRLSAKAERRAEEAIARRQDVERLYTFSRAILLISGPEPFPKRLVQTLAQSFGLESAALYDRRTDQIYRGGPGELERIDEQLRESARLGASFSDTSKRWVITAIRLGSEPIAALALQGTARPDAVLQGIANLVAIGLERARAQDLAHQVEAAQRSEQLRTTLLDAMAHDFKTPLTSIKAATTALLANPEGPVEARKELLVVADEEAERLKILIDDSIEMARLDSEHIDLHREPIGVEDVIHEAIASLNPEDRQVVVTRAGELRPVLLDRRLIVLAFRQLMDNALKYSPPGTPVRVRLHGEEPALKVEFTNEGPGIPPQDHERIFERFYRGASTKQQIPGSGLGLSIALRIAQAHGGTLTMESAPGETTFRITLPMPAEGERS